MQFVWQISQAAKLWVEDFKSDAIIYKISIKILTFGINGTFPFVYSSVSRTYILLEVNKYIRKFVS